MKDEVDAALGRIGAWAWRRHGEEFGVARDAENPLDRLKHEGEANAFQEVSKYIDTVRQARDETT